jgi:hypothetical protein
MTRNSNVECSLSSEGTLNFIQNLALSLKEEESEANEFFVVSKNSTQNVSRLRSISPARKKESLFFNHRMIESL